MKSSQLLIPDKIKVGFQTRTDTYTGQLGYVIYYDKKGVLRKEKSWQSWRDQNIDSREFDNSPTEGFVLNRNGGGGRGWDCRGAFIRVYDPRNFEFEISVENLLFILRESDCSRGKGLEGKFVYSWDRDTLVLLPVGCEDYKNSITFTNLSDKVVNKSSMVEGGIYITKRQEKLTYLGRYRKNVMCFFNYNDGHTHKKDTTKYFVFWNGSDYEFKKFIAFLAVQAGEDPNFAYLIDEYRKSKYSEDVKIVELTTKKVPVVSGYNYMTRLHPDGHYRVMTYYIYSNSQYICNDYYYESGPIFIRSDGSVEIVSGGRGSVYRKQHMKQDVNPNWIEPSGEILVARTNTGKEYQVTNYDIREEIK